MSTKVSIIIPIYNVEQYIQDCLLSVANQTMKNGIEAILVDDCGKDNSIAIAQDFISHYQGPIQFTFLHHQKNQGLSCARNTAIKEAKGDYLFFLDSDDEIENNCIEAMYSHVINHPEVDLVQGEYKSSHTSENPFLKDSLIEYSSDKRFIKYTLLNYNGSSVCAQNKLVKRQLLIENNLYFYPGIIHEDNHWTFFLSKHVQTMAFCKGRMYKHRYNPESITHNVNMPKEIVAYRTLIEIMSSHIDSFLPGRQKELILNTLLTGLDKKAYQSEADRKSLILCFTKCNTFVEKLLLKFFFQVKNKYFRTKLLHALVRVYKLND